jgi:hypothetical protein
VIPDFSVFCERARNELVLVRAPSGDVGMWIAVGELSILETKLWKQPRLWRKSLRIAKEELRKKETSRRVLYVHFLRKSPHCALVRAFFLEMRRAV